MEVQALHSICAPFHRKPAFHRQFSHPQTFHYPSNSIRRVRNTTSELYSPAPVADRSGGSPSASTRSHKVTVHDRQRGLTHEFFVPEDQYILHTAEDQNIRLPFACRHGCCTSCAVRVKSRQIHQPEALGISAELKSQVYWLQFGRYFARGPIERDDYALELAMGDE